MMNEKSRGMVIGGEGYLLVLGRDVGGGGWKPAHDEYRDRRVIPKQEE